MKKRAGILLVALIMMSAVAAVADVTLGPSFGVYVSPFYNIYSGDWNKGGQWDSTKAALISGSFVNMQNAQDPRFVDLFPILMTPNDESVQSFKYMGDYGQRLHFLVGFNGPLSQWQGNVQFKYSVLWDEVYWTSGPGGWIEDDPALGWANSSFELYNGFCIARSGFAWWSAYGFTSDTPEAQAALLADEQSYWFYQAYGTNPAVIGKYRWRENSSSPWSYLSPVEVRMMPLLAYNLMDPFGIGPTEATALFDGGLYELASELAVFGISFDAVVQRAITFGLPAVESWLKRLLAEANFDLIQEVMNKFKVSRHYALELQSVYGADNLKYGWKWKSTLDELEAFLMGYIVEWDGNAIFTQDANGHLVSACKIFYPVSGKQVLNPYLMPYLQVYPVNSEGRIIMILPDPYNYLQFTLDQATGKYVLAFDSQKLAVGTYIVYAYFRTRGNDTAPAWQVFAVD